MESNSDNVISIADGAAQIGCQFRRFSYPHQIVSDASMGLDEKRAILAAWASDKHAVDSMPTLRHLPGTPIPVTFSSIMEARMKLDQIEVANDDDPPPKPHIMRRRRARLPLSREAA